MRRRCYHAIWQPLQSLGLVLCRGVRELPSRHHGERTCALSSTQIGIISLVTSSCLREWVIIIGLVDSGVICIAETVRPCLHED